MDQHTYPGTDILINNFDIKDKEQLRKREQEIVSEATGEILELPIPMKTKDDYKFIHKYIFSDIYPWAGEFRTTYMSKPERILGGMSVEYGNINSFNEKLDELFEDAQSKSPGRMKSDAFKKHVMKLSADIWRVHPFREGNTRTISIFADRYCHQYGYKFDSELIRKNAQHFRDALVQANAYNAWHKLLDEDQIPLKEIFNAAVQETTKIKKQRIKRISSER